eukprot:96466_1
MSGAHDKFSWTCTSCNIPNTLQQLKCLKCNRRRFLVNKELSTIANPLSQHRNINTLDINEILHVIQKDKNRPQLLSFIFDAYNLIRYNQILENNLTFQNISQFISKFPSYQQTIIDQCKPNTDCETAVDFFTKLFDQYCSQFGGPISIVPSIKIKDNVAAFISYIFGMNAAIKQYITPQPKLICPLVIDFWIIPNGTVNVNNKNEEIINNDIGNIYHRLKQNKLKYIKRKCSPNILQFSKHIMNCLLNKTISTQMKKHQLSRVIFIVDRRYSNKDTDSLYCILPPPEYGKIITNSSYDALNISHWYCTCNYLLPHLRKFDENIRGTHIGASTNLNGYMFNLSFLIHEFAETAKESETIEEIPVNIQESKTIEEIPVNYIDDSHDMHHIDSIDIQQLLRDLDAPKLLEENQLSTANVKIRLNTQNMTIRFCQSQIINLITKYFVDSCNIDFTQITNDLFSLNLYDPYFHIDAINKLRNTKSKMKLGILFSAPVTSINKSTSEDTLHKKCRSHVKIFCQTNLKPSQNNDQLELLIHCMDTNATVQSPWNLTKTDKLQHILIESTDFCRPRLNLPNLFKSDNFLSSIYDAIFWNKAQNEEMKSINDIEQYIKSEINLGEAFDDSKEMDTVIEGIKNIDKMFNASTFMTRNTTLLIDDGIVAYAYYISIFSHIISNLLDYMPFQLCITFICKRIVPTKGHIVKDINIELDKNNELKNKYFNGQQTFQEDMNDMINFVYNQIINCNVQHSRINIVIDRRQSHENSTEATVYGYYCNYQHTTNTLDDKQHQKHLSAEPYNWSTNYNANTFDNIELSILTMNETSTIPNITSDEQSNPHLLHINIYHFKKQQVMSYCIRNNSCIRFFPELM